MIVAFSTSSPQSSVALFAPDGAVLCSDQRDAPMAAGGACLEMLGELLGSVGKPLGEAALFVADAGPGSFTGIRVGITLAKILAYVHAKPAAGVLSFDLVDSERIVAIRSKKGWHHVRVPGEPPELREGEPPMNAKGYGPAFSIQDFPHASNVGRLVSQLQMVAAFGLQPAYLAEPSISQPKAPYKSSEGATLG